MQLTGVHMSLFVLDPMDIGEVGYVVLFGNPDGESVEKVFPDDTAGLLSAVKFVADIVNYEGVHNVTLTHFVRDEPAAWFIGVTERTH